MTSDNTIDLHPLEKLEFRDLSLGLKRPFDAILEAAEAGGPCGEPGHVNSRNRASKELSSTPPEPSKMELQ
jgi:hypothetical protein